MDEDPPSSDEPPDAMEPAPDAEARVADAQPEPTQPEPTQPEPTQPEPIQPEPIQPEPAQPEPAQPEPAQPALGLDVCIAHLLATHPGAARILLEEFDLPCYDCPARFVESLGEGLAYHPRLDAERVRSRLEATLPGADS